MAESIKAHAHRVRDGWYDKYIRHPGIDIGATNDPLNHTFRRYDLQYGDPDATFMEGIPDNTFMTVYCSHILEHVTDPHTAVKNWFRILAPGGHLIIMVPHRDMYEKKTELPSHWNHDHKSMWLPDKTEPPCTYSLKKLLAETIPSGIVVSFGILDEGFVSNGPLNHSSGEYSIEAIVQKAV